MPSFLQQLENNEAVLLMYLADELPADDRAEVEQLLATDAGLRAALQQLTGVQEQVMSGLAALDEAQPPRGSQAGAVRRVASAITRWHLEGRDAPPAAPAKVRGLRLIPWWAYPLTAAAAIIVAFVAWSENRPFILGRPLRPGLPPIVINTTKPTRPTTPTNPADPSEQDPYAQILFDGPGQEARDEEQVTRELHAVAVSQDKGDLFGNDW